VEGSERGMRPIEDGCSIPVSRQARTSGETPRFLPCDAIGGRLPRIAAPESSGDAHGTLREVFAGERLSAANQIVLMDSVLPLSRSTRSVTGREAAEVFTEGLTERAAKYT
jgi:hypothetical protein